MNNLPAKPMITALTKAEDEIVLPDKPTIEIIERYLKGKHFWMSLKKMFSNYFNGQTILNKVDGLTNETSKELLELTYLHYLSLYGVINYGWKDIRLGLEHLNTKIKTPGDALIYILSGDACMWMKNSKCKSETLYRAWLEYTVCKEKNLYSTKLETCMRRLLKQENLISLNDWELPEHIIFRDMCVNLAIISKSKIVIDAANEFHVKKDNLANFTGKKLRGLW